MPSHSMLLFALCATSFVSATSQKCYSLTGTELDNSFAPCNPNAKHSGCCATNRASGADICLDNGLCMATKSEYMGTLWQPGCTDSTGKATECPQLCPGSMFTLKLSLHGRSIANAASVNNDFDGLNPVPAWNIQTCDFGTYCCRAVNDRRNCCDNSTAPAITTTSIGAFQIQTATAVSSSTSTAATSEATAIDSPSNSDLGATLTQNEDVCKSEKHKTAVVGGTIGGILGVAVVALMGIVFWMSRREQRQRKLKEHYEEQFAQTWAYRKAMAASTTSTTDVHEEFMGKSSGS